MGQRRVAGAVDQGEVLENLHFCTREAADASSSASEATTSSFRPGIFEDSLRARRIEYTAGAETRQVGRRPASGVRRPSLTQSIIFLARANG